MSESKMVNRGGRLEWIDILKRIGICLMVACHIINPSSKFCKIVYTFHMPLFFFVSGLLFKENRIGVLNFAVQKFKRLIPQYFFAGMIAFLFYFLFQCPKPIEWTPFSAIFMILKQTFLSYLYGIGQVNIYEKLRWITPCGPAWFIPCLFFSNFFFYIIYKFSFNKIWLEFLFIILFSMIGIFVGKIIFLPWSIDIGLSMTFFIFAGYHLKSFISEQLNLKMILISFFFYAMLFFINYKLELEFLSINNRVYGIPFISFLMAFLVCVILCYISQKLEFFSKILKPILNFFGKNSNIILLFHLLFLNNLWEKSILRCNSIVFFISTMIFCSIISVFIKYDKYLSMIFNIQTKTSEVTT